MKEQIVTTLAAAIPSLTPEEISTLIEIPPNPEMGDFAFPCFRLAKTLRKAPDPVNMALCIKKELTIWRKCQWIF